MVQTLSLEGFSQTCPDPQAVTAVLEPLGLPLHFQLDAQHGGNTVGLPAQYHYRDEQGTEVIFLAGKDHPEDGIRFPTHASRWWVFGGGSHYTFNLVVQALSAHWGINWRGDQPSEQHSVA